MNLEQIRTSVAEIKENPPAELVNRLLRETRAHIREMTAQEYSDIIMKLKSVSKPNPKQ